jgi:hypothetical protein
MQYGGRLFCSATQARAIAELQMKVLIPLHFFGNPVN